MTTAPIENASPATTVPRDHPVEPGNRRERFLAACRCQPLNYPPIWFMRQAGRVLPEYRALKAGRSFLELVRTPELAAEVTVQPIVRFDFDAAILFSDILVVPEALGQNYHFHDGSGIEMAYRLDTRGEIDALAINAIQEKLNYVPRAIRLVRRALAGRTALLGFAGSPWTLANFMLEGGSSGDHQRALALFRDDRATFDVLLEKLTRAVTVFLQMQIEAGVDAIQIFDSLGGLLPQSDFEAASGKWIRKIIGALNGDTPTIVFSKGTRDWRSLVNSGTTVIGVDSAITLAEVRQRLPRDIVIQGNLAPAALTATRPEAAADEARRLLEAMRRRPGYIFNLGHGVPPEASLENISAVINTVRNFL